MATSGTPVSRLIGMTVEIAASGRVGGGGHRQSPLLLRAVSGAAAWGLEATGMSSMGGMGLTTIDERTRVVAVIFVVSASSSSSSLQDRVESIGGMIVRRKR